MHIHFIFIGEGSSDEGLVPHLEELCVAAGADEVSGVAPDFSRLRHKVRHDVLSKIDAALSLEPTANLLFVHRDADSRDPEPRYREINTAVAQIIAPVRHVCVVPVQELEAWLLLDETEIRRVAENPNGRVSLNIHSPHSVENLANPKEKLRELMLIASETSGRRRQRFAAQFDDHRRLLMDRLNSRGPLKEVPSWIRLTKDVARAIKEIKGR